MGKARAIQELSMRNTLVAALAATALIGGMGLAYGQVKTEKGDPPAASSYSIEPKKPDQGMTAATVGSPPPPSDPKGGVKAVGQPEHKGSDITTPK